MKAKLITLGIAISIVIVGFIVQAIIPESYMVDYVLFNNRIHGAITLIPLALWILALSILLQLKFGNK